MGIRPITARDLPRVREINEANHLDVGSLTPEELAMLVDDGAVALAAVGPEGAVVGFAIAADEGSRHQTAGMAWAWRHNRGGLHLDRVAFDMRFSGLGLGPALYDEIDAEVTRRARGGSDGLVLTALVRVDPPNPHAVDFHASRGFEEVDRGEVGTTTMALLAREYRP